MSLTRRNFVKSAATATLSAPRVFVPRHVGTYPRAFGIGDYTARSHVNSIIEKLEVSDCTLAATTAS